MAKGKKQRLSAEELLEQALIPSNEQPYKVLGNWIWTRLGNLVTTSKEKTDEFTNKAYKYIGLEHMQKDSGIIGFGSPHELKSLKNVFHTGDILYGKLRPYLNKHDIVEFDGVCSTDILVFKVGELTNSKYLNYFLDTDLFIEYAVSNSKGINLPRVSEGILMDAIVPLPPLAEQQRIVDRIESLFAKLDQAKELAQNALDSFETRKAAILHKAFTGELTVKWREEHGVSLDSWEEKRLNQVCKISSGGTPSRQVPEYYIGDIPWVKTGEIAWNYINDSEEKITPDAIKNSSAKLFKRGTVLVAMYGQGLTRGRAAILDIDAATNQAVCALIPNVNYDSKFLFYYFMNNYWSFREKAFGGNQPNYSAKMIGNFSIFCPSLPEQQEIVRIVDSLLQKEQKFKELIDVTDKIGLMKKAILARAFRGELGTNDPNEESALDLLKRVILAQ